MWQQQTQAPGHCQKRLCKLDYSVNQSSSSACSAHAGKILIALGKLFSKNTCHFVFICMQNNKILKPN